MIYSTHKMEQLLKTSKQLVRYALVASIGLAVDFGTAIFAKEILGLHYLLAVCSGFVVGLILTYILSNRHVFGQPKGSHTTAFVLFGIIGVGGLLLLNVIVWLLTGKLGLNYIISKAFATVAVFLWNFFARKTLYHDVT